MYYSYNFFSNCVKIRSFENLKKKFPRRLQHTRSSVLAMLVPYSLVSCSKKHTPDWGFLAYQPTKSPLGNRAQPRLLGWDRD